MKANVGALRYKGATPPESLKDLPKAMYQHFPEMKESHAELFEHLTRALTLAKEGKENEIPERDVYDLREKTKMFVLNLGRKLKEMKERGEIVVPEEKNKDNGKKAETVLTEKMINEKEKKK